MKLNQKYGSTLCMGAVALLSGVQQGEAWTTTHSPVTTSFRSHKIMPAPKKASTIPVAVMRNTQSTKLSMYNLPPGGGGGGKNDVGALLSSVGFFALTVAFFLSPLGGFVLTIMNSFLLLALLLPVLGIVGFQAWQYFNTISGACPNCGAPVTVLKSQPNGEDVPSVCFSCGAIIQANYENTGIDNVTGRSTIDDQSSPFGGGGASIFDIFGGGGGVDPTTTTSSTTTTTKTTIVDTTVVVDDDDDYDNTRKMQGGKSTRGGGKNDGIIDVDVDDQPFQ